MAEQREFVRAARVTDLDVDGSSHVYVASWKGATFTYTGEEVGYIARVTPKGFTAEPLPDFDELNARQLIELLGSESHRRRLEAQRQLLRREITGKPLEELRNLASNTQKPLETRVAALFTLRLLPHENLDKMFLDLMKGDSVREYAIRALGDCASCSHDVPAAMIADALKDDRPRVRNEALFALARLNAVDLAAAMTPLLADSDRFVAHSAMQALRALKASAACFTVLDDPARSTEARAGAIRVLQALHQSEVVSGLLERLEREKNAPRRQGLITALCRLHATDGEWKGDSWGTRPDTSGPYYQPAAWAETTRIEKALAQVLAAADESEAIFIGEQLARHKVHSEEMLLTGIALSQSTPALVPALVRQLERAPVIPEPGVPLLVNAAVSPSTDDEVLAGAVTALAKVKTEFAARALLEAMPKLEQRHRDRDVQRAKQAFLRSAASEVSRSVYMRKAGEMSGAQSDWAEAALAVFADSKQDTDEARKTVRTALEESWKDPRRQTQFLRAVALAEHRAAKEKVLQAARSENSDVAEAAREAARVLRIEKELAAEPAGKTLAEMSAEEIRAGVTAVRGELKLGEEIFSRQTCVNCHTVRADEPLRGPFLGNIATIYKRGELADAILLPNKTIAQGFAAHHFLLKDGTEQDGFVTLEAADKVTIRNTAGEEIQIKTSEIEERNRTERSLMPEGLAANLSLREFASLLDYLEALAKK